MTTEEEIKTLVAGWNWHGDELFPEEWTELDDLLEKLRQEGYDDGYREGDLAGESWGREHCGCSD